MTNRDAVDERLRAVERAITGDDQDLTTIQDAAQRHRRVENLDERLTTVEDRLTELEAAVQAVRGYVGNVRAVNREVERRADAALAAVEGLEGDAELPEPALVYPPPERPPESSEGEDDSTLLARVREAL